MKKTFKSLVKGPDTTILIRLSKASLPSATDEVFWEECNATIKTFSKPRVAT